MTLNCSRLSVNEMTMQNVQRYHYLQPWGEGALWAHRDSLVFDGILVLDENYRFITACSCDPYMGHTLKLKKTHFTEKKTQRMAFEKNF